MDLGQTGGISLRAVPVWFFIDMYLVIDIVRVCSLLAPGSPLIEDPFYGLLNGSEYLVYVSWRYPEIPGAAISHFKIEAKKMGGIGDPPEPSDADATDSFFLLKNLNRNTRYTLIVQAASNSSLGVRAVFGSLPLQDFPLPGLFTL